MLTTAATSVALGLVAGACSTIETIPDDSVRIDASTPDTSLPPPAPDASEASVAPPTSDKTAPSVVLTATPARVTRAGTVELRVTATDASGIAKLRGNMIASIGSKIWNG